MPRAEDRVPLPESSKSAFKHSESTRKCIKASQSVQKVEEAYIKANNYCMYNLIFLSKEVAELALDLSTLLREGLYCEFEISSVHWDKIKETIQSLENQIRKELSNNNKRIESI